MELQQVSRRQLLKLMGGVAAIAGLAACAAPAPGGTTTAVEPAAGAAEAVTLRLMTWGGPESAMTCDAALRGAYPELNEQHTVEAVVGGGGDFEVAEALRLALAAGSDIPDMVQFNRTQIAEFAAAEELLVLDDIYDNYSDDVYSGALALCEYEGNYVCFPFELKSKVFHYRKDLFEEQGIKVEDIKTVGDFITIGQAFNDALPDSHVLNLGPQPVQYWLGELLSAYDDVRFADEAGNYLVAEHQAFIDTFQFLKDIHDSGIALPIDDWSADWQQAFADEAICGILIASWMKFFLPSFAPEQGGLWGTSLWPSFSPLADQQYGSEAGGSVYVVPKRSEHVDLSADYLTKMFLEKTGAMAIYEVTGTTPLMASAREELMEKVRAAEKPEGMTDEAWNTQPNVFFGPEYQELELQSYEYVKVLPYDPAATREVEILQQWLIKYLADEVSQGDALASAQADMESQIGNPYAV